MVNLLSLESITQEPYDFSHGRFSEYISSIFLTLPLSEKSIILMDDDIKKAIIAIERQLEERKE